MTLRACARAAEKSSTTMMENLKKLGWIALAGFAASLGAVAAIAIVLVGVESAGDNWKKPSPVSATAPAESVIASDVRIAELTTSGGVRGVATNQASAPVSSMRIDLQFSRGIDVLHRCQGSVELNLKPKESTQFLSTCQELDPRKLTSDISPAVIVTSVYPKLLAPAK